MVRESLNYGQACVRRSRVERHVSMSHAPQPARQNPHRIQPSYSVYQRVGAARRALASGRRARSSPIVFVLISQRGAHSERKILSRSWERVS